MESKQGMVVPACNASTQKAQQEGQRDLEASLCYTASPVSETKSPKPKTQKMEKNWILCSSRSLCLSPGDTIPLKFRLCTMEGREGHNVYTE